VDKKLETKKQSNMTALNHNAPMMQAIWFMVSCNYTATVPRSKKGEIRTLNQQKKIQAYF
jgi:hypothetical protein